MEPRSGRLEFTGTHVSDYVLREGDGRLYVLLHGFKLSARYIFAKFAGSLPEGARVLAVNAPYPLPERREEGYRVGFSWYFYDATFDDYFVGMKAGVQTVAQAVAQLAPDAPAVTLIGYSQGGYLAPFAAAAIPRVDRVVGIACEFLVDELGPLTEWEPLRRPGYRMDAIHGEKDEQVSFEGARVSHRRLCEAGARGEFLALPGEGHAIKASMQRALAELFAR